MRRKDSLRDPKLGPLIDVILAAGRGTRMLSDLPKVLQPLAGVPLLAHVLERAAELQPATMQVVYGHGGEQVREIFSKAPVLDRTGAAARHPGMRAAGHARGARHHRVLILYGDVPMLRPETLRALIEAGGGERLALLTATLPDPGGYGRIVRNARARCCASSRKRRHEPRARDPRDQ